MRELRRLLGYARRYWPHLLASTILMAVAGAAQGAMALLTKPLFDKVLNPNAGAGPIPLLPRPVFHHQLYLDQLLPLHNRTVWTLVSIWPAAWIWSGSGPPGSWDMARLLAERGPDGSFSGTGVSGRTPTGGRPRAATSVT